MESLLEERLAARLWWRAAAHPEGYELESSVQLLALGDGPAAGSAASAEASFAVVDDDDDEGTGDCDQEGCTPGALRPTPQEPVGVEAEPEASPRALLPEACLLGVRDAVALEWAALTPGAELVAAVEELWGDLAADLDAACRSTDAAVAGAAPDPSTPGDPAHDGGDPAAGPDAEHASGAAAPLDLDDASDQSASAAKPDQPSVHPGESDDRSLRDDADPSDDAVQPAGVPAWGATSDAELVEAVAACERQIAALAARRDQIAGVFASRRAAEADADVADARAATARDGKGRPWAIRPRSTAPSELCARLGIGSVAADALVERGLAAVGAQRDVAAAMAAGALPAAAGSWMLEQLSAVRTTAYLSALERESTTRERALAEERAAQDAARAESGQPPLSREQLRARAAADQAEVDARAEAAAAAHAEQVAAAVRRELLERATGTSSWSVGGAGQDLAPSSDPSSDTTTGTGTGTGTGSGDGSSSAAPSGPAGATSRPTAGAGLGPNRRAWTKRLNTAVHRADADAAQRRAAKARAGCSTARWSEADGQAALQLRGPAEDIAVITAAMDARARRRQQQARAAERAAAREQGRPFDRGAVGSLDAHRIAAVKEWATAALEISETSGVSGTWYPIARTAASKPVVHLVLPWTVLAGVSTIGAQLAGYGPIGAVAALRIAADGLWRRVLADPACGAAVGIEEGAWRPSTALARLVGLRWWSSTLPSSTRAVGADHGPAGGGSGGGGAGGGQLDHVQPYAAGDPSGGPTEVTNLQLLAQSEHLLKQAGEHARPGHGWSVAVERTGPPGPGDPVPAPGDGVVWTAPTGHTYRVSPQVLLDPEDTLAGPGEDSASGGAGMTCDSCAAEEVVGAGGTGGTDVGGLPGWVHRLLADVLPAWVGWPPDGRPAGTRPATGTGESGQDEDAVVWSTDWARAVLTDAPPEPAPEHDDDIDQGGEEPYLFDDLPAA
ncbi:hypothetical protein [Quadrisphaera setariae]|uniref:HNH endonuclease n=1 Tax=Quadrisphaera setariae TaxID=2593304 RepID=A0A5C8ZE81_9ACTN|nr:hypothetical protein [Quadrisphaera setariae]TXR55481.1 hypothetical protein FMM08_14305 [Quadrisphaera setariae]